MRKLVLASVLAVPMLSIGTQVVAQTAPRDPGSMSNSSPDAIAPDNTKSNKVDPTNRHSTADQQKNDSTDVELAKRIRQSVMADKTLSTYGHNVKIVAVNGTVTLNGVVSTTEEKMKIGEKASSIAGAGHVVDDLKVASK